MLNRPAPYPCPQCGKPSRVIDVRESHHHTNIRRRRVCEAGHKFTTYEIDAGTLDAFADFRSLGKAIDGMMTRLGAIRKRLPD